MNIYRSYQTYRNLEFSRMRSLLMAVLDTKIAILLLG